MQEDKGSESNRADLRWNVGCNAAWSSARATRGGHVSPQLQPSSDLPAATAARSQCLGAGKDGKKGQCSRAAQLKIVETAGFVGTLEYLE